MSQVEKELGASLLEVRKELSGEMVVLSFLSSLTRKSPQSLTTEWPLDWTLNCPQSHPTSMLQ
jgi:hypothetical protein